MKNTQKTKSITCRIVSTGTVMQVNTIDEILSPGHYKIDACGVTASDGFPDGVAGECLSAYLEVSDTNHSADNLKSAAVGQTLTYTNAEGDTAVYHRSGTNKDGKVEWSAWSDTAAIGLQNGSITSEKLSKDVRTKIDSPLRPLFIAAGAEYNDSGADKTKTAPWGETVTHKAGHYYLNGLGDITEEQMVLIYSNKDVILKLNLPRAFQSSSFRSFFGTWNSHSVSSLPEMSYSLFLGNKELESALFCRKFESGYNSPMPVERLVAPKDLSYTFNNCTKLKYIHPLDVTKTTKFTSAFAACSELCEIRLYGLSINFSLEAASQISKESILYTIIKALPSSPISITLHPDAYARLADDVDIIAALEEKKNITLVA